MSAAALGPSMRAGALRRSNSSGRGVLLRSRSGRLGPHLPDCNVHWLLTDPGCHTRRPVTQRAGSREHNVHASQVPLDQLCPLTALCERKHGHAEGITFKPLAQFVVAAKESSQLLREVNVVGMVVWGVQQGRQGLANVIQELCRLRLQFQIRLSAAGHVVRLKERPGSRGGPGGLHSGLITACDGVGMQPVSSMRLERPLVMLGRVWWPETHLFFGTKRRSRKGLPFVVASEILCARGPRWLQVEVPAWQCRSSPEQVGGQTGDAISVFRLLPGFCFLQRPWNAPPCLTPSLTRATRVTRLAPRVTTVNHHLTQPPAAAGPAVAAATSQTPPWRLRCRALCSNNMGRSGQPALAHSHSECLS